MELLFTIVLVLVGILVLKRIVQGEVAVDRDYQQALVLLEIKNGLEKKIEAVEATQQQLAGLVGIMKAALTRIMDAASEAAAKEQEIAKYRAAQYNEDDDGGDGGPVVN